MLQAQDSYRYVRIGSRSAYQLKPVKNKLERRCRHRQPVPPQRVLASSASVLQARHCIVSIFWQLQPAFTTATTAEKWPATHAPIICLRWRQSRPVKTARSKKATASRLCDRLSECFELSSRQTTAAGRKKRSNSNANAKKRRADFFSVLSPMMLYKERQNILTLRARWPCEGIVSCRPAKATSAH